MNSLNKASKWPSYQVNRTHSSRMDILTDIYPKQNVEKSESMFFEKPGMGTLSVCP